MAGVSSGLNPNLISIRRREDRNFIWWFKMIDDQAGSSDGAEVADEFAEPTAPEFSVTVQGLEEEPARLLGEKVHGYICGLSRFIDIERLDGVTVALDYPAALAQLDRGFQTSQRLSATDSEIAVGTGMAPAVLREGVVKTHIVLNANMVWPLMSSEHEMQKLAIYLLAHECAHVEVQKGNDLAMPGTLLQRIAGDIEESVRWQIIMACWDEYAASRTSASFGMQWQAYEETFVASLKETWDRANGHIRAYRYHSNHDQVLGEVAGGYGNLMKYASYLLGDLHGQGLDINAAENAKRELGEDWFGPYFERLGEVLADAWGHRGGPGFRECAEAIGSIAIEVIEEGGLYFQKQPDGQVRIDIPLTYATTPV
jgi:hypothetical protein